MSKETRSLVNLLMNLAFGIFIPIWVLNSLKIPMSPEARLGLAIAFPLFYGAFEWWQTKKHNFIALLGLINVVITGGFGLLQLEGSWFSFKEAIFPLLIGLFVYLSALRGTPAFGMMLLNPDVFDRSKLDRKIEETQRQIDFQTLILRCNNVLALSFGLSALLNFLIAEHTFIPLGAALNTIEKANALNEQIALMHKRGFLGIALPSMVMMLGLLLYFFKKIETLTGDKIDSFILSNTTGATAIDSTNSTESSSSN